MSYDVAKSSGELAVDTQVAPITRNGLVTYLELTGNGGVGLVRLYSGSSAVAANKIAELNVADGATITRAFHTPVGFNLGLWLDVNATSKALCHFM